MTHPGTEPWYSTPYVVAIGQLSLNQTNSRTFCPKWLLKTMCENCNFSFNCYALDFLFQITQSIFHIVYLLPFKSRLLRISHHEKFKPFQLTDASAANDLWKHCGKRRNCSWWAISFLPQCLQFYSLIVLTFTECFHFVSKSF